MKVLNGGIRIVNSKLTNLSFFKNGKNQEIFEFGCQTHGFYIQNNTQLIDAKTLVSIDYQDGRSNGKCDIRLEDNMNLDAKELCDNGHLSSFLEMSVTGNLRDCGCQGGAIFTNTSSLFTNCRTIFGGLKITNASLSTDFQWLSNITVINGDVDIGFTSFQNLSFFENLEFIRVDNFEYSMKVVLDIHDNPNMTRLLIPNLKELTNTREGYRIANIQNLHSDFCLTIREIVTFLESNVCFMNLHAKYCEETGDLNEIKLCHFSGKISELGDDCVYILGDLKIGPGDKKHVAKLKKISHVFGRLIVKNSDFEDLNFLSTLEYIGLLDESLPVIEIVSNKNLKNAHLSNLKSIITRGELYALVHDNHPELVKVENVDYFQLFDIKYLPNITFYGGDWGCPSDKSNVIDPNFYNSCTVLINGLKLSNASIPPFIENLSNLKILSGAIEITDTQLRNLSFLENVELIESPTYEKMQGININIHNNPEMTRLGLKSLKTIDFYPSPTINFENLHPDFCLTLQEILLFLDSNAIFLFLHARVCDFEVSEIKQKTCRFENMTSLESSCIYLFGDVLVGKGEEKQTEKLKTVNIIFGTLTIQNTDLDDLKFLGNLYKMANLNESRPLIRIINNTNMKNAELPKMNGSICRGFSRAVIEDNYIFDSVKSCMKFQYHTGTNVTYNGGNCRGYTSRSAPIDCLLSMFMVIVANFLKNK
ncbi:hypothetical protein GCK72_019689 [Caenorhabditis remanei]|uniref:Receptor L-domain domain-containing protein n=1 Tax=Caenorhabditis remanei TaxID=31234 RepID=A0A6A5GEP4_CAERE|nr:hypothetical protein GCK72_019689 [Caenorhabditis remanei]KAF1753133.1 hypothetical protein GCK72_019689 [Caenorhabditis remanei]